MNNKNIDPNDLLSTKEAAQFVKCKPSHMRNLDIKYYKLPLGRYYHKDDLNDFLKKRYLSSRKPVKAN